MSISISNIGQSTRMNSLLGSLRSAMLTAQTQLASGRKSESFSGLGTDSIVSLSLRGDVRRLDTYVESIDAAMGNTEIMDKAMNAMTAAARDVFATLAGQLRGGDAPSQSVNISAQNALETVQNLLNTSLGGRLLFGGDAVQTAPMADADAVNTNVQAEIAAWLAGSQDAAATIANIDALGDTELGLSAGLAAAGGLTVRADDGLSVDYTVKANNDGFTDLIKGLSLIANLDFNSNDVDGYWQIYDAAMNLIDNGARSVDVEVADLALSTNALEDAKSRHEDTKVVMDRMIGDVEDVDTAEALTRLQTLQTQLEVSYRAIASLRDLSLVNYL